MSRAGTGSVNKCRCLRLASKYGGLASSSIQDERWDVVACRDISITSRGSRLTGRATSRNLGASFTLFIETPIRVQCCIRLGCQFPAVLAVQSLDNRVSRDLGSVSFLSPTSYKQSGHSMAHRQSYTRRTSSYGGQDPYSPPSRQQTAARSPPPSSAAADSSRPTLLAGQHARYSSADLYALQAQPATRQSQQHPSRRPSEEAPRRMSSQAARGWESDDEDEDDDDDDDGPGFASYGEAPTQRRSYQAPHPAPVQQQRAQQQQQQQQQAMYQNPYQYQAPAEQWTTRPVAPPIVSCVLARIDASVTWLQADPELTPAGTLRG